MRRDENVQQRRDEGAGRSVVRLDGCRPTPLASYLKALGILRLVATQEDDSARGWWEEDVFRLESDLHRDGLVSFFLNEYEPTPILAPWNGGSGFYPKDNRRAIEPIRDGAAERFSTIRNTIRDLERRVREKGLDSRPAPGDDKLAFVTELRSTASDDFLVWLDAAIAMSTDDLLYPPLLGTGGNDGRLDFTNNFMSNLIVLIDPETGESTEGSADFLREALFAAPVTGLQSTAIGQFSPASAGGPNAESGFAGGAMVNPWDFVLMMEGAVLLASSTARRLESRGRGVLAFPFTVRPTGSGSGASAIADEGPARAETWMPLWCRPSGMPEIGHLLAEGRIVVGERMPRDGLDAARAIAKLGVDRGIESFQRFGYLQRSGLAYLATPLDRVRVTRNPDADLIDELERHGWLDRFRTMARADAAPARLTRVVHTLESALFDLTADSGSPILLQRCLVALGECQRYLSVSPGARENCPVGVPVLSRQWAMMADDGSPEYAISAALASLHGGRSVLEDDQPRGPRVLTTAEYMAPVSPGRLGRPRRWSEDHANRVVWAGGAVDRNLGRMMMRRLLDQREMRVQEVPLHGDVRVPASLVAAWLNRPEWDRRIAELMPGLALVDKLRLKIPHNGANGMAVPAAYCLLKPFFVPTSELERCMPGQGQAQPVVLPSPAELVRLLLSNQPRRAFDWAQKKLRARGLVAPQSLPSPGSERSSRLLAALMVPIARRDLRAILRNYFNPDPDNHTESNTEELMSTSSSKDD